MSLFFNIYYSKAFFPKIVAAFFLTFLCVFQISAQDEEKDPVALFNKGQDAHEKGDLKTALDFYNEALKIAPEFPEAEYQKGSALKSLGQNAEAEKSFRKSTQLRENWILPLVGLGETLVQSNKLSEAETVLNKAVALEPNNSAIYVALTELRIKEKSSPERLKELLSKVQSLSASNSDSSLFAARGALERKLNDFPAAQNSLKKALQIDAQNSFALSEYTELAILAKNFDEAEKTANNLIKKSPNFPEYRFLLAKVYASAGKSGEALKILETLDGKNADVVALRNSLTINDTKDISVLEAQLATDPQNASLLGRLCNLTRTVPAKALEYCRQASEKDPSNINHAIGFGAALVQAKQFASAITLLRRLLQIEPDNQTIRANLALALFELKNYAEAKNEYEWLIKNSPNLAVAYYFLAICHDNLREYEEAKTNYRKFLELADSSQNQLEIDKVNLRLPSLERQIQQGGGSKKRKKP